MIKALLSFIAGGVVVAAFFIVRNFTTELPPSELASPESTAAVERFMERLKPHLLDLATGDIDERRAILDEYFYQPKIDEARELYAVTEQVREIAGVYTEIFEPAGGVPRQNSGRVLINLHGGGFSMGARTEGRLESIPVASVAGMRVISVDYRQGPEHRFPAASEDVALVYQALLQDYAPGQIGIFGCSAGGLLTAQAVAWFDANGLPRPGAIGIFCAGAGDFLVGDAALIADTLKTQLGGDEPIAYFDGASWDDPLVAPIDHPDLLGRFPPSLVITSTRDLALSSAIATHQRLVGAGAESELHVYEGLTHYFFSDTGVPESRQVFDVIARFFDRHLAR
ncbi:MAG: alpha/beta hydrolase fold domain-containing protein [Halioglobus sp.]|nr:alpha/beta hydrolase fold domain-containing protein [Halioglobus sp.]